MIARLWRRVSSSPKLFNSQGLFGQMRVINKSFDLLIAFQHSRVGMYDLRPILGDPEKCLVEISDATCQKKHGGLCNPNGSIRSPH